MLLSAVVILGKKHTMNLVRLSVCVFVASILLTCVLGQSHGRADELTKSFANKVRPVLERFCYDCHGNGEQEGSVALDQLDADLINGADAEAWHAALDAVNAGDMPPEDEEQPNAAERQLMVDWMTKALKHAAAARQGQKQSAFRRLTKEQYSNTLSELLGLPIRLGDRLPDDAKSKMGFSNNGDVLQISPLHIEYYQAIAKEAIDKAVVTGEQPNPTRYRVDFGTDVGLLEPGAEFNGFQTVALNSDDFRLDVLDINGVPVKASNRAIERAMQGIKKNIGIGLRGSATDRFGVVEQGAVLYSALPHRNVPPRSWQGPSPNMKLVIKNDYPRSGVVRFRVDASRGPLLETRTGLIGLRNPEPAKESLDSIRLTAKDRKRNVNLSFTSGLGLLPIEIAEPSSAVMKLQIPKTGYYQIDLVHPYAPADSMPSFRIAIAKVGRVQERLDLDESLKDQRRIVTPVTLAYLEKGKYRLTIGGKFFVGFSELIVTPLPAETASKPNILTKEAAANEQKYGSQNPSIRVFAGARTDDGMDFETFDTSKEVTAPVGQKQTLEFFGSLEDLPIPVFDPRAKTVHANTMVIGLWNDYLVKHSHESGPPLLIHSLEIEAPYYPQWPPKSHTDIFFDSPNQSDPETYTREVLTRFIERAYRRPLRQGEVDRYMDFWKSIRNDHDQYEEGVKEVLVAVVSSPNFLFLTEPSQVEELQHEKEFSLASKLAYFLWNSPPDQELLSLASEGRLREQLKNQVDRMIADPKAWRMVRAFTHEWLRVDRQQLMDTDTTRFPDFTRFVKEDMPEETYHFVHHVLTKNQSILNFIDSDFAMLNQNLAEFYGIENVKGSFFRPVELPTDSYRGGLLSQGAFLNGHSDGVEPHPIKRAVWLKEKILGDPAPPPPPNVPELDPDTPGFEDLTLKEQLELHRNKASCLDCHRKIDPYGVAFEELDAVGRIRKSSGRKPVDAVSTLPDGQQVDGLAGIKKYILDNQAENVTKSVVEHLFAYANGRDVTFADEEEIQQIVDSVTKDQYRFRSVVHGIVFSQSFFNN